MATAAVGCQAGPAPTTTAGRLRAADKNIVDTMAGPDMASVSTFLSAIQAAGLVDYLSGPGPFTVFAPTDDAFSALPPGRLDDLLAPENKPRLRAVLLYHVHPDAAILAADFRGMSLSTADGKPLALSVVGDAVTVNTAKVIKADVVCKNGVIHWVDKVLTPPAGAGF